MIELITKTKKYHKQCRTLIACLCFFVAVPSAYSLPNVSKHHQIMAGLLLHLTSFTQWQKQDKDQVILCILGDDPFKQYINDMVKSRPKNRLGQLIVVKRPETMRNAHIRTCNIVYIDPEQIDSLWSELPKQHNILLVSHDENFISQGGMINFVRDNNKVKLEVNLPAVLAANLKLSSALLKHAKVIPGTPHHFTSEEE